MNDRDIDGIFEKAAESQPAIDPALLDRISSKLGSNLAAVKPIAPPWLLSGGAALVCWAIAIAVALVLKPHGIARMDAAEIVSIFGSLAALTGAAAMACVAQAIPGSRTLLSPTALVLAACAVLLGLFAALFHDYATREFVYQGIKCLIAGLVCAVPVWAGVDWLLRRGFPLNARASGVARGTLAGLAGVAMLEIHCPNFEVLHVIVWHIAVLPLSGALGMLAAWIGRERALRRAASG